MGRTNPTYRNALRGLEREWEPMGRALRREYQADFDRLFDRGRAFADAAGYANPPDPERAFFLSVLLAHEVELRKVRAELEATRERLEVLESGNDGADSNGVECEVPNSELEVNEP
ncbi:hypothetical protein [Natrarchaeobaculum aegyptiacum]|uniref:DUF8156 domain-containing protein n=1 Tax=Natrarchaeobaculum aegyptiacum TaxID=745377 RepID=A0A2Z2HUF0_9EURY|nr:hypothetical protein [Natrarchaeobaculum aegyptiacum]ARS89127.1 hypothetical protein B1756_04710 [Natrarchaeobaculum aegyptiacum]